MKLPVLGKGARGETVRAMQALLQLHGCKLESYGADGDYGGETENAVREYQRKAGVGVDGVCGPVTWSRLLGVSA